MYQDKKLHFISMDIPFPPNYGGIIDVFYKLKSFHELGVEVYLHLFGFKEDENEALKKYAKEVYFYPIYQRSHYVFQKYPISVRSRESKLLYERIKAVKAPIFFESLKTTFILNKCNLNDYSKYLRLHNIEQNYFSGLAESETNLVKKSLFYLEAKKYIQYENIINMFDNVFTLSKFEQNYIQKKYNKGKFVPVFHGNESIKLLSEKGKFALYHGDLRASDNCKAVDFLIEVFKEIDYPFVIASGSKEDWVKTKIKNYPNIQFVKLKDFDHLKNLFENAHLNIAWSFQESGTKLKVINALFNSRFSIINENVIDDEKINKLCIKVSNKSELIKAINQYKDQPFSASKEYRETLEFYLNDKLNAEIILKQIFN
ncbi:glycosyltransferase [Empedobacter brevis]|uniref:glycosyltransferase n=1 Tax=Empedobacter brevis TaxID=247 RepID=UPI0039AFA727